MEMLSFALINSLIITAIYACTWDGMILGSIRAKIDSLFNKKWGGVFLKPLYGCIICMSSIWGGSIFFFQKGLVLDIIPHILLVAGINTIISGIIYLAYERNANQ